MKDWLGEEIARHARDVLTQDVIDDMLARGENVSNTPLYLRRKKLASKQLRKLLAKPENRRHR